MQIIEKKKDIHLLKLPTPFGAMNLEKSSFLNDARVNWQRFTTLLSAANDKNLLCGGNRMTAGPLPEGDASRRGGKPQMLWWS